MTNFERMKTEQEVREALREIDGELDICKRELIHTEEKYGTVYRIRKIKNTIMVSDLAVIIGKALGVVE